MSSQASETKSIIVGLLTSNPLKCTIKQLCDDFLNIAGYPIPVRQLGFSNVEHYLRSIPDTVQVNGNGIRAQVDVVAKPTSAHIREMVARQKSDNIPKHKRNLLKKYSQNQRAAVVSNHVANNDSEYKTNVDPNVQNRLRKLIMCFPDGIWCTQLPKEFEKMFHEKLEFLPYGYISLMQMCADLPNIFHFVQPNSHDFILYDRNKPTPPLNQNDIELESEATVKYNLNFSQGSSLIPPDIVYIGDVIPREFSDSWRSEKYLDISIGEIYDITDFWIFTKFGPLNGMMSELQKFYHERRNQYLISEMLLTEGLYCVVSHMNKYHRCAIADTLPHVFGYVKVLFIDYGSVVEVPSNAIWYLSNKFRDIPCQAIRARLSHIVPLETEECTRKFHYLVRNRQFVAEIMDVVMKDKVLSIYLADVQDENNIFYVNDILVEKGVASYI